MLISGVLERIPSPKAPLGALDGRLGWGWGLPGRSRPALPSLHERMRSSCAACLSPSLAPAGRLGGSRGLVRPGGLLLVSSTYCWSERTAASQLWLGGTTDAQGNAVRSADGLAAALGPEFELVQAADLPQALRSCGRMYSVAVMHCTLWRRVA